MYLKSFSFKKYLIYRKKILSKQLSFILQFLNLKGDLYNLYIILIIFLLIFKLFIYEFFSKLFDKKSNLWKLKKGTIIFFRTLIQFN